jgi:AraC-like DNA-binding protein
MKRAGLICLLLFMATLGFCKIRIEVRVKAPLPLAESGLYLAASFNNWNPGDPAFKFKKIGRGIFAIELAQELEHFEYKITQGSWAFVEGDSLGAFIPSRMFDFQLHQTSFQVEVKGWEKRSFYQVVIKQIPANTPHDASLYLVGNFNNWNPRDEAHRLHRQSNGSYRVNFSTELERIEFKFTRGTWNSVEGQENGRMRPNRVLFRSKIEANQPLEFEIATWEDLSGSGNLGAFAWYDMFILFAAFQGFLLVFAIPTIQDFNRKANRWLVFLLFFVSCILLIRTLGNQRDIAQVMPFLQFVPDFLLIAYPPAFYLYVRRLLFQTDPISVRVLLHFIPSALQIFAYTPFLLAEVAALKVDVVSHDAAGWWAVNAVAVLGWFSNAFYTYLCLHAIQGYRKQSQRSYSYEENLQFLLTVLVITGVCLLLWAFTLVVAGIGYLNHNEIWLFTEKSADLIWLIFSIIPHLLGYFAIHQPEIFKVPQPVSLFNVVSELPIEEVKAGYLSDKKNEDLSDENLNRLRHQVEVYMTQHKPYVNPKLTLNELAGMLKLPPYLLSKVINEGYDKNFFDFINTYRIEEFKHRMEDPHFQHYTLLSIAFEVGFNSKTAFNRSFKKITNQSPSEFFQSVKV